jgi:hypothetical protein
MGVNTKNVAVSSQATPLAEDFMKMLQGWLANPSGTPSGPQQRTGVGSGVDQYMNSPAARIGGVNTAGQVQDYSTQLMDAVTARSGLATDRNAAQIRESFGASGNRISSSLAAKEGQYRNEAGMNLDQIIAQILTEQGDRTQSARQFDVGANQAALNPYMQAMQLGALPEEVIASPDWKSQLLTGVLQGAGAYLGGGGSFGLGGKTGATSAAPSNAPGSRFSSQLFNQTPGFMGSNYAPAGATSSGTNWMQSFLQTYGGR